VRVATSIFTVSEVAAPSLSVTVRVAVYVPGAVYACGARAFSTVQGCSTAPVPSP